jgi:two-component system response regulator DesR
LLAHQSGLLRGALAAVLGGEADMQVVAEASHGDELLDLAGRVDPHVAVVDIDLPAGQALAPLCVLLSSRCTVLLLGDRHPATVRRVDLAQLAPRVGLIAKESPPAALVDGVRRLVCGETVLDGELARAALIAVRNPLTEREKEVLLLIDAGLTARDIAVKLYLSHGTVRNHVSRVLAKTGGRTRIDAIRIAKASGWI